MDGTCTAKANKNKNYESPAELEELELQTRMERIKQKILVLSGKGGVGKSTIAANLAVSLAKKSKKTGLLDVDLHGPSIPGIFGLKGKRLRTDSAGAPIPFEINENLKIVSIGLLIGSEKDAVIWRGPMKYNVIRQLLKDVNWGELDYLVIDSPPGTGDEPLSVSQLAGKNSAALVVTTPQYLAVADVRRSISFCRKLNLPIIGIIENMSGFICPHCGKMTDLFGSGGGERLARETEVPFLGGIPIDPQIVLRNESGDVFPDDVSEDKLLMTLGKIADSIIKDKTQTEEEKTSMKIAIPTAEKKLCMHFGHCDEFALIEADRENKRILKTDYLVPPPHEPGVLPKWLGEKGANVIIAGGMGQRAQVLFAENNIEVVVGAMGEKPEDIAIAYLNNTLQSGENVCDH